MSADIGALPAESAQRSLGQFALRFRVSGVLAFLILLSAGFALLRSQFLTPENLSAILSNAAILMIVAGAQAVILITRNLDVSVGSIMGFAAYLTADFAARHHGVGGALVLMPLAIGGALGAINGLLVAYGRVSPLIATLGTMSVYRGLTYVYAHGQEVTSNKLPHWMIELADMRIGVVPLLALLSAAVVCALAAFLRFYPLGRRMYAVGSNPEASAFFGLRTQRIVLLAYVVGGAMCGLAGFLYAARVGTVTAILASGWELTSLEPPQSSAGSASPAARETSSARGSGAIVLATIDNGLVLLGVPEFWRMFIQGVAIVGAATADVVIAARIRESLRAGRRRRRSSRMRPAPAAMGADACRFDSRCRRVVRHALALLSQRRSDPLASTRAVRLSRHSRGRPRRGRDSLRDRYFAGLDAGVRRCSVFQVLNLRRSDSASRFPASSRHARHLEP